MAKYLLYGLAGEKIFISFLDELGIFGNFGFRKKFWVAEPHWPHVTITFDTCVTFVRWVSLLCLVLLPR